MKKQITAIIDTEESNNKILACIKTYFLGALQHPSKQLIEIKVDDIEKKEETKENDKT